eukprot:TRINITY_DN26753_c0_g1_i7.p1 TRINITY_DN26753_c0_g1~~TRINITY_DN26753_c0_g1_i7.p1  ORF type:complete len:399 (+),score=13.82 TRINITY_DN26753_c0_g1_i7:182-1378(+)
MSTIWKDIDFDSLRLILTDLCDHLAKRHAITLDKHYDDGFPLKLFATKELAARAIVHLYVRALHKARSDPARTSMICKGDCMIKALRCLNEAKDKHGIYLLVHAYADFIAVPSAETLYFLKSVLRNKCEACQDGDSTAGTCAKQIVKQIISAVPDSLIIPYQDLDIPEETQEEKLKNPLPKVRTELHRILDEMYIRKAPIVEFNFEAYGCTIIGNNVLMNLKRINPTASREDIVEAARRVLILLHEIGHGKRAKYCSKEYHNKHTPPRYKESEAGSYFICEALGLKNLQYIAIIKNMTKELAAAILNINMWKDLKTLKAKLKTFADANPLPADKYTNSSAADTEAKGLSYSTCSIGCITPTREEYLGGCTIGRRLDAFMKKTRAVDISKPIHQMSRNM